MVVASFTRETAAQSFAYHAHRTADSDKPGCYPWFVCHDKTLYKPAREPGNEARGESERVDGYKQIS